MLVDLAKANIKSDIRTALKRIPLQLKYLAEEHYKDMWLMYQISQSLIQILPSLYK